MSPGSLPPIPSASAPISRQVVFSLPWTERVNKLEFVHELYRFENGDAAFIAVELSYSASPSKVFRVLKTRKHLLESAPARYCCYWWQSTDDRNEEAIEVIRKPIQSKAFLVRMSTADRIVVLGVADPG